MTRPASDAQGHVRGQQLTDDGASPGWSLREEMDITRDTLERRKAWLEFTQADVERLAQADALVSRHADELVEELYAHIHSADGAQDGDTAPTHTKGLLGEYFLGLTRGAYDVEFVEERLRLVGGLRQRFGPDPSWYLGTYNLYLRAVGERLRGAGDEIDDPRAVFESVRKVTFLDLGFAFDAYMLERERTIWRQEEELRKLSTPVLQLQDELLLLPIVGFVDTARAQQLTEQLLHAIRERRARVVVIDVTGVGAVDSRVANHIVQTVEAARLMGAAAIVTGLSAEVAQTLVRLGVDLSAVRTVGDLQGGIEEADRLLGTRGGLSTPVDGRVEP